MIKINKRSSNIGQGIAFAGLCGACAWMEVSGVKGGAGALWVVVVLWAWLGNWE